MDIVATGFDELVEIHPKIINDQRGYFFESFRKDILDEHSLSSDFVQDNQSFSEKGVVRGLHLQLPPYEQIKLVRCVVGKVLDVVVDLRKESNTFGKHFEVILSAKKGNMLYIPGGFAHGIAVLEDSIFAYKCSSYYNKESESGLLYSDEDLNINWGIESPIVSDKDKILPDFKEYCLVHGLA